MSRTASASRSVDCLRTPRWPDDEATNRETSTHLTVERQLGCAANTCWWCVSVSHTVSIHLRPPHHRPACQAPRSVLSPLRVAGQVDGGAAAARRWNDDGTRMAQRIIRQAPRTLNPGGSNTKDLPVLRMYSVLVRPHTQAPWPPSSCDPHPARQVLTAAQRGRMARATNQYLTASQPGRSAATRAPLVCSRQASQQPAAAGIITASNSNSQHH